MEAATAAAPRIGNGATKTAEAKPVEAVAATARSTAPEEGAKAPAEAEG